METVTYNPKTRRLEWGDGKFLTVSRPWNLPQEEADRVLGGLVATETEVRKKIAEEVRVKGCNCGVAIRRYPLGDHDHYDTCPEAIADEIEQKGASDGQ